MENIDYESSGDSLHNELQYDISEEKYSEDYKRMTDVHRLLALGYKEMGKLADLEVYEVILDIDYYPQEPIEKLMIPEEVVVVENKNPYDKLLIDAFSGKKNEIEKLNNYLEEKRHRSYVTISAIDSFRRKIVRQVFGDNRYHTLVTNLYRVGDKQFVFVVQIEKNAYMSSYKLLNTKTAIDEVLTDRDLKNYLSPENFYDDSILSFREYAILKIINEYMDNISKYRYKTDSVTGDRLKYLLRDTARDYIGMIQQFKLETNRHSNREEYEIYKNLDMISSLNYESAEVSGNIFLTKVAGRKNLNMIVKFTDPVKLCEYKKIRKLLEISTANLCLLSDSILVYGLVDPYSFDCDSDDMFMISFLRRNMWKISGFTRESTQTIVEVEYSFPKLQRSKIDLNEVLIAFYEVFNADMEQMLSVFDIINAAAGQKHGTMLIFSEAAQSEAERLKKASLRIENKQLDAEVIKYITAIDGAVLFDQDGVCHAIGVILDGMSGASVREDISRGARYNAAAKYLSSNKHINCVAIIFSEDGNIDIMSNANFL